jgi:hypothetical protein
VKECLPVSEVTLNTQAAKIIMQLENEVTFTASKTVVIFNSSKASRLALEPIQPPNQ